MSYHVNHQYGGLRIPPGQEPQALWALVTKLTNDRLEWNDDKQTITYWPYWAEGEHPLTFADAMYQLGLSKDDEDTGWRLDDSNGDVCWHDDDKVFQIIVPFAEEGQIITFVGEDDERWGYLSRGHKCLDLRARIVWFVPGEDDNVMEED